MSLSSLPVTGNLKTDAVLFTPACHYYSWADASNIDFIKELTPHLSEACDLMSTYTRNVELPIFDGFFWTRWTSHRWWIPLLAISIYIPMVWVLPGVMKNREKMKLQKAVIAWNFSLSAFSFAGLFYCVPHLLANPNSGLFTAGFYPSVCSHASKYGFGEVGFFVFLFIYSKLAELLDTFFLLVRKSPVILLHWYHHVTVLLYCWHSYSVRIGTGLWFAAMNYTVHAIMYFYFGLTQCGDGGRKFAKKFAMLITTMQLLQMVVGIIVTVSSVVYHLYGHPCHVSLVNSAMGLAMYTSYFILFLQLFLDHYVFNKKSAGKKAPSTVTCPPSSELVNAMDAANKAKVVVSKDGAKAA